MPSEDERRWAAVAHCRERLGYTLTEANEHLFTVEERATWRRCVQGWLDAHP